MNNITQLFNQYKIPLTNDTMESFCKPKKFTLQAQQKALANILSSKYAPWYTNPDIRGILLYHQIGAGKTCTSIAIAEKFKDKKKILVILPASLIDNFLSELRSECTGNNYVTHKERQLLNTLSIDDKIYNEIITKSYNRIKKFYTIYSYHKLINLIKENKITNFNNTLLIIDEIQNMISINGSFYRLLANIIQKSNNTLRIILLTATPMFNSPIELALTINLLKTNNFIDIQTFNNTFIKSINNDNYKINNINLLKSKLQNLISYYRGAPPVAYPSVSFNIIKCNMTKFQYKNYIMTLSSNTDNLSFTDLKNMNISNISENFFIGPRLASNIVFPNKLHGNEGFQSLKGTKLSINNIKQYSIKFYKIIKKINKSTGTIFIYSNFKEEGGIKSFIQFIEFNGWKNYITYGAGIKRYAIWSGNETLQLKSKIKYIFNHEKNKHGDLIKIIIGSPSIKEGVSLLRVQQVHIMEPYWNMSRVNQIIGRAVRFCSHKDVPKKQQHVYVFMYLAMYPNYKTIDQHIWSMAQLKDKLISKFEHILKEIAIDCKLFYNRNSYPTDTIQLKCNN